MADPWVPGAPEEEEQQQEEEEVPAGGAHGEAETGRVIFLLDRESRCWENSKFWVILEQHSLSSSSLAMFSVEQAGEREVGVGG